MPHEFRPKTTGHSFDGEHGHTLRIFESTSPAALAVTTGMLLDEDYRAQVDWLDVDAASARQTCEAAARLVTIRRSGTVFVPTRSLYRFTNAPTLWGDDPATDAQGFAIGSVG